MQPCVLSGRLLAVLFTLLSPAHPYSLTSPPHRRHPDLRAVASAPPAPNTVDPAAWAAKTVAGAPGAEAAEAYYDAFAALAADPAFAVDAWARAPLLISDPLPGVADSFTLADVEEVVEADFLDAGKGVADGPAGWQMAPVSLPRGNSFEDAKMRWIDVRAALDDGTVVFNSAGGLIPKLAAFSLAALDAFELPNCLNLYLTGRGVATSAPPHTDKQDVFVLQARAQFSQLRRAILRRAILGAQFGSDARLPPSADVRRQALARLRAARPVAQAGGRPARARQGGRRSDALGAR